VAVALAEAVPAAAEHLTPADHWVGDTNRQRNKLDRSNSTEKNHPIRRHAGWGAFVVMIRVMRRLWLPTL
jgi:hypothetical protein